MHLEMHPKEAALGLFFSFTLYTLPVPLAPRLLRLRLQRFQLARRLAHAPEATSLFPDQIPRISKLNDRALV